VRGAGGAGDGEGLSLEAEMTCTVCRQKNVADGLVTLMFEREGTVVVIKEVPGLVCQNCGEEYVPDEAA
jgi:YgiT-type zinc finger domain-containing protein